MTCGCELKERKCKHVTDRFLIFFFFYPICRPRGRNHPLLHILEGRNPPHQDLKAFKAVQTLFLLYSLQCILASVSLTTIRFVTQRWVCSYITAAVETEAIS